MTDKNNQIDDEFLKKLASKIEAYKNDPNSLYIVNSQNHDKYMRILQEINHFAKDHSGKLLECHCEPKDLHGEIRVELPCLDLYKQRLEKFIEILKDADVLGINPSASDSLIFEISVNNIWVNAKE